MPDNGAGELSRFRLAALTHVSTLLQQQISDLRSLEPRELALYRAGFTGGWRIPLVLQDRELALDVLVDSAFPYSTPRIGLYPTPPPLSWPHVESNGLLCLLPAASTHSPYRSDAVVSELLQGAITLIAGYLRGEGLEQFQDEFVTYWGNQPTLGRDFYSLLSLHGPSRMVWAWLGRAWTLMAETRDVLRDWCERRFSRKADSDFNPIPALLLWLSRPPRPADFPQNVGDIYRLIADDKEGIRLLTEALIQMPETLAVALGARASTGAGLVGLYVKRPRAPRHKGNPLTRGFRSGNIPHEVLISRYRTVTATPAAVVRLDPGWVHGRDHDNEQRTLAGKKVVVVGCGSVGSPVAGLLAQAGVGSLILIDAQRLGSENVSRHALGLDSVGIAKAIGLETALCAAFPHLSVRAFDARWQAIWLRDPALFLGADLVIATTGDWGSETELNHVAHTQAVFPPVLYGWTEAHAAAGHAILTMPGKGCCLQCEMNETGQPLLPVTWWPNETLQSVPACGGQFQPYGAVQLTHIHALVAELVLDTLSGHITGPVRRTWIGRRTNLEQVGGTWNPDWISEVGDPGQGGLLVERPWEGRADCPMCCRASPMP